MTNRGPVLAILVAMGTLGCQNAARDRRHDTAATPDSLPSMMSSSAVAPVCTDSVETAALACSMGAATRHGDTLVIELSGVGVVRRVNDTTEGDHYVRYQYAGRMGAGSGTPTYHILNVAYYESSGVELINALSGDSLSLGGAPILSPDGSRFATTAENAESCEANDQLDIWRITGDKPVREFSLPSFQCTRPHSWWPSDVAWHTQDTVTFLRNSLPSDPARRARGEADTTRAVLVHDATGWQLEPRSTVASHPR